MDFGTLNQLQTKPGFMQVAAHRYNRMVENMNRLERDFGDTFYSFEPDLQVAPKSQFTRSWCNEWMLLERPWEEEFEFKWERARKAYQLNFDMTKRNMCNMARRFNNNLQDMITEQVEQLQWVHGHITRHAKQHKS